MPVLVLAKDGMHWVDSETGAEFALSPCWPRPIPVGERLPEEGIDVLIRINLDSGYCFWSIASYSDDDWWIECQHEGSSCETVVRDPVTHWLPLPPTPE